MNVVHYVISGWAKIRFFLDYLLPYYYLLLKRPQYAGATATLDGIADADPDRSQLRDSASLRPENKYSLTVTKL